MSQPVEAKIARIAALAAIALSGCIWPGGPPETPHGNIRQEPGALPPLAPTVLQALTPGRLVVIGRFDTTAVEPIGGLYDRASYHLSPLYRTYYFRDGAVEIFEHVTDALRAAGLNVLKDYEGNAEPKLLEAPLRNVNPILVTATVRALQHDLIRTEAEERHSDAAAAHLVISVNVTDTDGTLRLGKDYTVDGALPYDPSADVLQLLGLKLTEQLTRDSAFVAAIDARPRGS